MKLITKSVLAGLLIGIAGCIYMSCDNKYIGSMLFSLGLIAVILLEAKLFTGVIGYVDSWNKLLEALLILVINLVSSFAVGLLYKLTIGTPILNVGSRFVDFKWYAVLFKGFITGVCIYLAVELYRKTKSLIPVIIAVMAFILSGSYHVIADVCYLGTCELDWSNLLYLLLVAIGNSIGSLTIRFIQIKSKIGE